MSDDVVSAFLRRPDEGAAASLVEAARDEALVDEQIAELADGLARSGLRLPRDPASADVASTGGPSSLSTLLCPLVLRVRGLRVPKLGVPGRPAGGIDVLQTIPGFDGSIGLEAVRKALSQHGYVHLVADERWAPLDRRLFSYRQRSGGQAVPALVIASILAKKLAAGAVGAGLEIRVAAHGNFGNDPSAARANAARYKRVAALLRLRPVALLTDASQPFQPYVGRGEALLALANVCEGRAEDWLADHTRLCVKMADAVADAVGADTSKPVEAAQLQQEHEALLNCHGTDLATFDARVATLRSAPRVIVSARSDGFVQYDLARLRDLLVSRQDSDAAHAEGRPPDPAGVVLAARPGTPVLSGAPLISLRVPPGETSLAAALADCVQITRHTREPPPGEQGFELI